jgi:hypothetical protein
MAGSDDGVGAPSHPPLAVATAMRRSCFEVAEFIRQVVRPLIDGVPDSDRKFALFGQLLRVQSWLTSLEKLDHPSDFQAVLSAERSLFETTLDIVLISRDLFMPDQMDVWEDSAKLKQAEAGTRFYEHRGQPVPFAHAGYAQRLGMREAIHARRKKLGWKKHPERWTGPDRSLLTDAQLADRQHPRFRFEEWYETEYRQLCWNVHGSGLVVRGLPMDGYPEMIAISLKASGDLSEESARSVLYGLHLDSPSIEANLDLLETRRVLAAASILGLNVPPAPTG